MAGYAHMAKQIDLWYRLQAAIREDRQTKSYVAYCPTIDLYSAGRTRVKAKQALKAAAVTYVRICHERGILNSVLQEKGFTATPPSTTGVEQPDSSLFIAVQEHASEYDDIFDLDILLHLLAQAQQNECPQ